MLYVVPVPAKEDPNGSMKTLTGNLSVDLLGRLRLIDLVPRLERLRDQERLRYRDLFWQDDGHMNEKGNRLFAMTLAEAFGEARE